MQAIKIITDNGNTYHCCPEDRIPIGRLFDGIKHIDAVEITPDMYSELRASERLGRAAFFGEG